MASIRIQDLGVRFQFDRQRRVVTPRHAALLRTVTEAWGLRDISLSIGPGEGVALIGPTGSGKTSLLRIIGGVLVADTGALEITGRVGSMLSIDAGLTPTLTGRENGMLLEVLAGLSRAEARARLERIQDQSGLGLSFDRPASSYSQGMRARLAFTAVQQIEPEIVLLDEVHEAFDREFREVLERRARELLDRGGIVVAAGHDHEVLARICSRAILLDRGMMREDGPFEEVRRIYNANHGPVEDSSRS
jgi:ABC-type polysaccharide/polyol phosphate transport system ATPase subunit